MHIRLIAVGDRQPAWVDDAFDNYSARFPREWKFRLDSIATVRRGKNDKSNKAAESEGQQILARTDPAEQLILLDERGKHYSSPQLSKRLAAWQADGRDLCFVIVRRNWLSCSELILIRGTKRVHKFMRNNDVVAARMAPTRPRIDHADHALL